jgi:hypothetical protein
MTLQHKRMSGRWEPKELLRELPDLRGHKKKLKQHDLYKQQHRYTFAGNSYHHYYNPAIRMESLRMKSRFEYREH